MRKITRRSFLTAAAACGAAAALSACGGSSSASSSAAASSTVASASVAAASNGEKFTVGICQLVQHAALDAATQGFEDALTASFGENVTFDFQNAQGDSATCATIANGFVSSGVALIMANATPALQAAQAATNTIPILGTSVTEYGVALGLDNFSGTVGGNVSGTSDLAPLDQQADMIVEWMPEVKKVGLLYCSAEANSQYQVDEVQKYLEAKGVTATQYAFSDSNDLSSVCQKAADENDALFFVPVVVSVVQYPDLLLHSGLKLVVVVVGGTVLVLAATSLAVDRMYRLEVRLARRRHQRAGRMHHVGA